MKKLSSILVIAVTMLIAIPAMAEEEPINLALNKPTVQSTTAWGGNSSRAVDGNTSGDYGSNSITHTDTENDPWWEVDLGVSEQIGSIRIWNRMDCCDTRLNNFYVYVSNSPFLSTNPADILNQAGVSAFFTAGNASQITEIEANASARYVRIQILGTGQVLSLAEVEIFEQDESTVPPKGTITYSSTEWTDQAVVATLTTSKPVTITNNGGSSTYTFERNGSFTFEFIDQYENIGSAVATVSNIMPPPFSLSIGEIYLPFHEDVALYTTAVASTLNQLTLTPISADTELSIKINGISVERGAESSIPIVAGGNRITVQLFGSNEELRHTYTIMVMRPLSHQWTIGDTVRAVNAGFDIDNSGAFNEQDVRALLSFIQHDLHPSAG